nr:hypothetical protein BaRGS_020148 [Batillaria attramentaria]
MFATVVSSVFCTVSATWASGVGCVASAWWDDAEVAPVVPWRLAGCVDRCSANNCRSCGVTVAITSADRSLTSCRCGVVVLAGPGSTKVLAVAVEVLGPGLVFAGFTAEVSWPGLVPNGCSRLLALTRRRTVLTPWDAFRLGGMVVLQQYSVGQ